MATLYISEYALGGVNTHGLSVVAEPAITDQTVGIAAGASSSAAFNPNTKVVRLHTDAICSVAFGTAPTATAANKRMAANQTEYFHIPANQSYKVSVITNV